MSQRQNSLNAIFHKLGTASSFHSSALSITVNFSDGSPNYLEVPTPEIKQMKRIIMLKAVNELEQCRNTELRRALDMLHLHEKEFGELK